MTTEAGHRDVVEGTIRYQPVLGIEPAGHGRNQRARLANTLFTLDGVSVTVVFLGDRAEVAERLLVRGSAVRLLGVWNDSELTVDRFDIAGLEEDHRYRLAGHPASEAASDVDVTTLYQVNTDDMAAEELPGGPDDALPSPTAAVGHDSGAPAPTESGVPMGSGGRMAGRFAPGQRVTARDRGSLGTVVSVDDIPDRVRVRFTAPNGTTAVVAFTSDQLEADPPTGSAPEPTASSPPRAEPAPPQSRRSPAGGRNRERQPAAAVSPSERTPPAASAVQAGGSRRVVDKSEPVVGVLRVHTRRPEPSGELLL